MATTENKTESLLIHGVQPDFIISEFNRINESLQDLKQSISGKAPDTWLTIHQVREIIPGRPSLATLYLWSSKRLIPAYKSGNRLAFLKSEIDEFIKSGRKLTINEIEQEAGKASKHGC